MMEEVFGEGVQTVCKMSGNDILGYIKQFEDILRCFEASEEKKMKLFKDGLNSTYYALVRNMQLETYQKLKDEVIRFYSRSKGEQPEMVSIFRATVPQARKPKWSAEQYQWYLEGKCVNCGKHGHRAVSCPSNGQEQKVQSHLKAQGQH